MSHHKEYLGETVINVKNDKDCPYRFYTPSDWALLWIAKYGGIDGSHHKTWVLDQVAQILHGTPVIVTLAKWDDGQSEYRVQLEEPTSKYHEWVKELKAGEDGPDTYYYDQGIAP